MTAMSEPSHSLAIDIEWAHCDPAGIVWNPHFFEFFDTGTWLLFQQVLGVPRQKLMGHYDILGIPLVEAGANFLAPLKFGDRAELISAASEFRRSSFTISHKLYKNGKLAVDGQEIRVWAGRHPDDAARMRATAIPGDVLERFGSKR
jgi:4-hydroxybenzoyl-CoA thioesterase